MAKPKTKVLVTIDSNTIFRVLLILLVLAFLFYIGDVLVIAFIAFIIVSAITPLVDFLEKFYLPRTLVVVIIYILAVGIISLLLSLLLPAIGDQFKLLGQNLPIYSQKLAAWSQNFQHILGNRGVEIFQKEKSDLLTNLGARLSDNWLNIFTQAGSFLKGVVDTIAVFALAFFLTIQKKSVGNFFKNFIPRQHQEYAVVLVERIQQKMGYWLLGQITLNVIMGVLVYIGLTIIGIPYALLLAIIASLFEVIPYVGAFLSGLLGVSVALSISPLTALIVLVMYIVIDQTQHNLFVPLVMRQAVGLNPVAVVIAILIGIKVAGPLGLILAIPITAALSVFVSDFIGIEQAEIKAET